MVKFLPNFDLSPWTALSIPPPPPLCVPFSGPANDNISLSHKLAKIRQQEVLWGNINKRRRRKFGKTNNSSRSCLEETKKQQQQLKHGPLKNRSSEGETNDCYHLHPIYVLN